MKVEKTPGGGFALVSGKVRLVLTKAQYEDIFYALPQDNGTLFRLINDTVLNTEELRQTYKALLADAGGMQVALPALQQAVQAVSPG